MEGKKNFPGIIVNYVVRFERGGYADLLGLLKIRS